MRIEISDSTFDEVKAYVVSQGLPETAIGSFADAKLREAVRANPAAARAIKPDELVESFREFRGAMRGTNIAEIVADRRLGLD